MFTIDELGILTFKNKNNLTHRNIDEPAIIFYNGLKIWYRNGFPWRSSGPFAILPNGEKWYLKAKEISHKVKSRASRS